MATVKKAKADKKARAAEAQKERIDKAATLRNKQVFAHAVRECLHGKLGTKAKTGPGGVPRGVDENMKAYLDIHLEADTEQARQDMLREKAEKEEAPKKRRFTKSELAARKIRTEEDQPHGKGKSGSRGASTPPATKRKSKGKSKGKGDAPQPGSKGRGRGAPKGAARGSGRGGKTSKK